MGEGGEHRWTYLLTTYQPPGNLSTTGFSQRTWSSPKRIYFTSMQSSRELETRSVTRYRRPYNTNASLDTWLKKGQEERDRCSTGGQGTSLLSDSNTNVRKKRNDDHTTSKRLPLLHNPRKKNSPHEELKPHKKTQINGFVRKYGICTFDLRLA